MTKMTLAEFRDSTIAADLSPRTDQAALREKVRLRMEVKVNETGILLTVALLSSHFEDFPNMIGVSSEGKDGSYDVALKRENGVWRVWVDESHAYSDANALHHKHFCLSSATSWTVLYAQEPMGIPVSSEATRRIKALCDWGADPAARIGDVASFVPRHVFYAALGHGYRLANYLGVKSDAAFADGLIKVARRHLLGIDGEPALDKLLNTSPPLIENARNDDSLFVARLLANGASPDVEHDGVTAAWEAVRYGARRPLEVLAKAGANLHITNSLGETLLHLAASHYSEGNESLYAGESLLECLLANGLDPKRPDNLGRSALDVFDSIISSMVAEGASADSIDFVKGERKFLANAQPSG